MAAVNVTTETSFASLLYQLEYYVILVKSDNTKFSAPVRPFYHRLSRVPVDRAFGAGAQIE